MRPGIPYSSAKSSLKVARSTVIFTFFMIVSIFFHVFVEWLEPNSARPDRRPEWQTPHGLRITARSLFRIPFRRRHTGRRPRSGSDRPDHPGRNASHDRALENIFGHNRSCRHDNALADGNAGENRRVRPDPNVFLQNDRRIVVRQWHRMNSYSMSRRGISSIQPRYRVLRYLISPNCFATIFRAIP